MYGELSERFKELVLKTSDSERNLGFESLTLRQKSSTPLWGGTFLMGGGIRTDLNAMLRWSIAPCGLDRRETMILSNP